MGRENLQSGDLLLDTSWMMQALLLSGEHTIARATNAYPPGGAAWPANSWRFTRPWPQEREASGKYFALVNYLAMAPNTFDATHVPIEDLITEPDTDMGKKIAAQPDRWLEVFEHPTPSFGSTNGRVAAPTRLANPTPFHVTPQTSPLPVDIQTIRQPRCRKPPTRTRHLTSLACIHVHVSAPVTRGATTQRRHGKPCLKSSCCSPPWSRTWVVQSCPFPATTTSFVLIVPPQPSCGVRGCKKDSGP